MATQVTKAAIRIKVTGNCNRTCDFCHEEGDMKGILSVNADQEFFDCVHSLCEKLGISRVMLSGGEPTVHPALSDIIAGLKVEDISMTTNGIKLIDATTWQKFKQLGLSKVIISMHDAEPEKFIQLEIKPRTLAWGAQSLSNQLANLQQICLAGLSARINTVVYNGSENAMQVVKALERLYIQGHRFELRLLNNLAKPEQSQQDILEVCRQYNATRDGSYRRAGSSNMTSNFVTPTGFNLSTKISFPYFFGPVCDGCVMKTDCMEGFYGIRLERRPNGYHIRLCIYKHSSDVLLPWQEFLASDLTEQIRLNIEEELFD